MHDGGGWRRGRRRGSMLGMNDVAVSGMQQVRWLGDAATD